MEFARIVPAALVGIGGLLGVLVAMAQARDRRRASNGSVILTGLTVLLAVVCLTVLVASVLPVLAGWGVAFLLAMTILALLHAH